MGLGTQSIDWKPVTVNVVMFIVGICHLARRSTTWQRNSRKCCRNCFRLRVRGFEPTSATMLQEKRVCSSVCLYSPFSTTFATKSTVNSSGFHLCMCPLLAFLRCMEYAQWYTHQVLWCKVEQLPSQTQTTMLPRTHTCSTVPAYRVSFNARV